jgi:uncharacterized protein YbjT (DUF2867 family)
MTTTHDPILIIGGKGKTGRRVAERLEARGIATRSASRSSEPPFDWNDPATWGPALDGVSAAYVTYYPDLAFPGAAETIGAFARQAVENGTRRLVLLSGRGEDGAIASEQALQAAGADWTIVRSTWFAQNFSEHFLLEPVLAGVIALPAGDVAEPFVDLDDLADVAVAALTEDGHSGQVYELTGPRLLTLTDVADELTEITGRPIQYIPVTAEEYAAMAVEHGVPAEEVEALSELFAEVLDGRNAHLTDGVQQALGRQPRDFRDYATAAAATGVWDIDTNTNQGSDQ